MIFLNNKDANFYNDDEFNNDTDFFQRIHFYDGEFWEQGCDFVHDDFYSKDASFHNKDAICQ